MNTIKYRHARASGYAPAQAVAYLRGAHLPAKSYGRYMQDVADQRTARRVRRALDRVLAECGRGQGCAASWRYAWHCVRHAEWERNHFASTPDHEQRERQAGRRDALQFYHTTADY